MNSAFTDKHAETKAARIARVALRGALACALVLGAGTAFAQQHGDRRDDQSQQQDRRERFSLPQQDRGQREAEARAYEEQRRLQQQQQQEQRERRNSGRMTPDERRDLRRQINEAGMDLYPPRR